MARQKLPASAVAVSLALLTTGEFAIAQGAPEMEARIKAGSSSYGRSAVARPVDAMAVTPSLRYSSKAVSVEGSASALLTNQRWQSGDADLNAQLNSPSFHGIRAELITNASRIRVDEFNTSEQVDATGRLHLIRENGGAWIGAGFVRPLRIATASNVSVSSGGVWTRLGPATLRASVTSFGFTKFASNDSGGHSAASCPAQDIAPVTLGASTAASTSCRRESRLTDLEGGLRFEHDRVEVTARAGHRFGPPMDVLSSSRTFGSAQAAVWISSQLAAVAGGGREPAQPTRGLRARNFYTMGLMLAYWPIPRGAVLVESPANLVKLFEMRPAGIALQRVTARIGGVESVEIMGDFSDWAPVPLVRRGRDQWELLVPMSAGIHQINMRIDGGKWIAPPGLPSAKDDFNGEVGVVVIKS